MSKIKYYLLAMSLLGIKAQGVEMNPKAVFPSWDLLEVDQKKSLKAQFETIDLKDVDRQRSVIHQDEVGLEALSAFEKYEMSGNEENQNLGRELIQEGRVGCLIVAGGQGSRLNYTKPKGLYPVTLIKNKSLFQLFSEKILAAGKQSGRPLLVAIMTSQENNEETLEYFEENNYFGLSRDQIFFFSQKDLPLLDSNGDLFLESKNQLAMGPDGNASSLKYFVESGIWNVWNKAGVRYLNYMHVDNPLADPFDAELTGFHEKNLSSDVIVKCIQRQNPQEKLGVMFEQKGKVVVVEYSEISKEDKEARKEDGSLKNACGNIGLYSLRMDFVFDVATKYYHHLPFHKAWKAVKYLSLDGISKKSEKPIAWKFEKFIFDILPFAQEVKAILYPRGQIFAPLKNAEGDDSLPFVQSALLKRDQEIFERISGVSVSSRSFELDPEFYYPTLELLKRWKGKALPETPYIAP